MRLRAAVGLLSGGAIACEILQMRLLSIIQWHHFAFLVISLALLGYGASGAFLTVLRRSLLRRFAAAFPLLAVCFGVSSVGSFVLAQRLRLNPLEVLWDPRQFAAFASLYLLLAVPFFCAGAAIGLALMRSEGTLHRVYRADLVGAAGGAVAAIAALYLLAPETCLRIAGLGGWLAAALGASAPISVGKTEKRTGHGTDGASWGEEDRSEARPLAGEEAGARGESAGGRRRAVLEALLVLVGVAVSLFWPGSWLTPRMSEYKAQSKALTVPGVEVVGERSSPLGSIAALRSPRVPFRVATGLSLGFTGEVPEQAIVFRDGEMAAVVDPRPNDQRTLAYLDHLPTALAFELGDRPRTALLGTGGGSAVMLALRQEASEVHLVETDRQLLRAVAEDLGEFSGSIYRDQRVHLHAVAPRSFLAAGRELFDLIWLQLPAGGSPGARSLRESYGVTIEAVELMLERLGEGGLLAIAGEMDAPPRVGLKLLATVSEAFRRQRLEPETRIVVIRSWSSFLALARTDDWGDADLGIVQRFAAEHFFDLVYYPGMSESEANRFNLLDEPALFRGAKALLGPDRQQFIGEYKFDLRPASDDRPYFFHFLRWRSLRELLALRARGGGALIEWGYVLLVAAVGQAALAGLVLILLPLWVTRHRTWKGSAGRIGTYFLCLGLAFLLLEIAFIQRLTLFLADPLRAAATVLAGFLFFAGLGSGACRRFEERWAERALPTVLVSVAALASLYLFLLPPLFRAGLGLSIWVKIPVVLLVIAPLAFLMGMPFPLGLRQVAAARPQLVPWAWGVNGWASVLSAVLAALLSVHFGFTAVVATGCALYLLAIPVLGSGLELQHSEGDPRS